MNHAAREFAWGVKRALLSAGIGAGLLLGFEPFAFWMAGGVAALCLILLAESLEDEKPATVLFWAAIVCLSITLFCFQWIVYALTIIGRLSWLSAAALTVLYSIVVNLKIPFFLFSVRALSRIRLPRIFVYPALALAGDLIFYQIFPWYWGNAAGSLVLMQSARVAGVYGVSFLVFLFASAALEGFRLWRRSREPHARITSGGDADVRRPALGIAAGSLAASFLYGIASLLTQEEPVRIVRAAYIQPATKPALERYRSNDEFASEALSTVFSLGLKSLVDAEGRADLLILPESSVPFLGTHDTDENSAAGIYSTTYHAVIAYLSRFGSVDVVYNELNLEAGKLRNQAALFGAEGIRRSYYNKQHLVPFGEYLPLEDFLPLRRFFPEASRYAAGDTPRLLEYRTSHEESRRSLPPIPAAPEVSDARLVLAGWPAVAAGRPGSFAALVCYEGLFPELVRRFQAEKPDFFVNIANDAWFGDYLENYQHSGAVRLRAIETGRSVVRITLTGVSTAFGPDGRNLIAESKPGELATGYMEIPVYRAGTVYAALGNWPLYGILAAFMVYALYRFRVPD